MGPVSTPTIIPQQFFIGPDGPEEKVAVVIICSRTDVKHQLLIVTKGQDTLIDEVLLFSIHD